MDLTSVFCGELRKKRKSAKMQDFVRKLSKNEIFASLAK